ncbi:MAG: glycosyltransferase family 39 protein [Thermoanaerobaculia bacterium]
MSRTFILRAVTGLFLVLAFVSPFQRDLFVGDETKYGQVIREMTSPRTIAVPQLNGEPYTHKPPLHFWIVRALVVVFGSRSIWPFVLPSLVGTIALVWLTGRVAEELAGGDARPWAELVVASFALVWGVAQSARMDSEFVLLTTAAALFLWRYFETSSTRSLLSSAGCTAVATLVKGPFAPLILVAHFAFESLRRRRRPAARDLLALPVLLLAPLAWLVPAAMLSGRGWLEEILVRQAAGRVFNAWTHGEPIWFYVTGAPAIWFPWILFVVAALVAGWREERPALRFTVLWVAATFIPMSLISSKLPVYMLPTMPAAAVLTGAFLAHPDERLAHFARIGNRAILALVAVVGAVGILAGPGLTGRAEDAVLLARWEVQALFGAMFVAGAATLIWDIRGRMEATTRNALAVAICFAIPMTALVSVGMPLANEEASTARLVRALGNLGVPGEEIAMCYTPHLWTRDMPGRLEGVRQGGTDMLRSAPLPRVVVVRADKAGELGSELLRYEPRAEVRMIGKRFDVYELP